MKLAIIGTGYVGLITGACFAEFGYQTVCIDKDQSRIKELNNSKCPFYEPGVDTLLDKHLNKTKLLSFSNSLSKSINDADIIFITVGTPSKRIEGEADLSYVWNVAEEISNNISKYCIVVTKSTVPVGTSEIVEEEINAIPLLCHASSLRFLLTRIDNWNNKNDLDIVNYQSINSFTCRKERIVWIHCSINICITGDEFNKFIKPFR